MRNVGCPTPVAGPEPPSRESLRAPFGDFAVVFVRARRPTCRLLDSDERVSVLVHRAADESNVRLLTIDSQVQKRVLT